MAIRTLHYEFSQAAVEFRRLDLNSVSDSTHQLIAILIRPISTDFKIRKKTFYHPAIGDAEARLTLAVGHASKIARNQSTVQLGLMCNLPTTQHMQHNAKPPVDIRKQRNFYKLSKKIYMLFFTNKMSRISSQFVTLRIRFRHRTSLRSGIEAGLNRNR